MPYDVKEIGLAAKGKRRIEWAAKRMPVLREIAQRFQSEKPLKGVQIGACLHVTTETANLCRTLIDGGARVALCASNPLSTQDDAAASLVKDFGVEVFSIRGEDQKTYYDHINKVLDRKPAITMDDGADLVNLLHKERKDLQSSVTASLEETTTGIIRLRALQREGALKIPVFAVNDALVKFMFDNRYGTGQSTLDGIIRATNILLAGKTVVVSGYGWCGRGFAMRARGLGAKVVITEVDAIKALEAVMDGYQVMPIAEAARTGDVFCTVTGNKSVIRREHFEQMKDGAVICNSGHFNVELDLGALTDLSKEIKKEIRENVDEYLLKNGRSLFVLAEGRLVNLACAEGHPAEVMDMSFATQALTCEHAYKSRGKLDVRVHPVPREVEQWIARLKLKTMGVSIDALTDEQRKYLETWQEGT
jgi:adenosylhomocysteinase